VALWDDVTGSGRRIVMRQRAGRRGTFEPAQVPSDAVGAAYPVAAFSGETLVAAWSEGRREESQVVVRRLPSAP
jgi:hypothetical protein